MSQIESNSSGVTSTTDENQNQPTTTIDEMPASLNFLYHVAKLKHLDRTGWVHNGIERPETVAGHMYRMAIMSAFMIEDPQLDVNKCIKMSIVHDLGESIIGDITPHCGVSDSEKYNLELSAIQRLAGMVPATKGNEIRELFQEYEDGKTEEAKFVIGLDKFDMVLQAYEYEQREGKPKFLQGFFDSTKNFFVDCHPFVKKLVQQLYDARDNNIKFSVLPAK